SQADSQEHRARSGTVPGNSGQVSRVLRPRPERNAASPAPKSGQMRGPHGEDAAGACKNNDCRSYWEVVVVDGERPVSAPTPRPATAPASTPMRTSTRIFSKIEVLEPILTSGVLAMT